MLAGDRQPGGFPSDPLLDRWIQNTNLKAQVVDTSARPNRSLGLVYSSF